MADINKLKDKIKSTIYPNGKGAINASDHQAMLLDMADGMAETDTKLTELSEEIEVQFINENKGITPEGKIIASQGEKCTDIIPIKGANRICVNLKYPNYNVFFYDRNKEVVARYSGAKNNAILEVPNNAYFVAATDYMNNESKLVYSHVEINAAQNVELYKINEELAQIHNSLSEAHDSLSKMDETKADIHGSYPSLITGASESFVAAKKERKFIFSRTGGGNASNGLAVVNRIKGNSIVKDNDILNFHGQGLISTGFNQWDEQWEMGEITSAGKEVNDSSVWRSSYIPILPNEEYFIYVGNGWKEGMRGRVYDKEKNFIGGLVINGNQTFVAPSNAAFLRIVPFIEYVPTGTEVCVNISCERNGVYEPYKEDVISFPCDDLKSAGSIYDEAERDRLIKRVDMVDMGTLTWDYLGADDGTYNMVSDSLANVIMSPPTNAIKGNILCAKFAVDTADNVYNHKSIESISVTKSGRISVYSEGYTSKESVASFKEAMTGVKLCFALKEEEVIEFDASANLRYYAYKDGAERVIYEGDSSDAVLEIMYTENTAEAFDEISKKVNAFDSYADIPKAGTILKKGLTRVSFGFKNNYCNTDGLATIVALDGSTPISVNLEHSRVSNELFYQKENQQFEDDIYRLELPMAHMCTKLHIAQGTKNLATLLLDGSPYRSIVRQVPPILIRLDEENVSQRINLRIYTDTFNGVVSKVYIKDDNTLIYSRDIVSTMRVSEFYDLLKSDLENLKGYAFKLDFSNVENLTMASMVAIKPEGLPFVTGFSKTCKVGGTIIYDAYPVILDFQDNRTYNLDIAYDGNEIRFYLDNTYIEPSSAIINVSVDTISYGDGIYVLRTQFFNRNTLNCKGLIHGYTSHAFKYESSQGSEANLHIPIGFVSVLCNKAVNQGFQNLSVEEIGLKFIRNEELPEKCYFIEVDDFASLAGFKKLLSEEDEEGLRVMEILKMHGVKMGFAQQFSYETELINAIIHGTASDEQKNTLSVMFTNDQIMKIRSMMSSYGWTISVHTLIDNVDPTSARFMDFVSAVRKTIRCYERMYGRSPLVYVTSGTGNSSPYYRRLLPMYGLPIVVQDTTQIYSGGNLVSFVARDYVYKRGNLKDVDYNILEERE